MDFGDKSPLSKSVGNLDQIFGPAMWYPIEVVYQLASIAVFLLFGLTCRNIGRKSEPGTTERPKTNYRMPFAVLVFVLYIVLLGLDDLDDLSTVLKFHLVLGTNYWFALEPIYAIGSGILYLAFGKVLFEIGRH